MCNQTIICQFCNEEIDPADCDVGGTCEGNVFCCECDMEIEPDTGLVALLCGKCDWCKELMINDEFREIQQQRYERRER